jgi:hypothetical protein
MSTSYSPKIVTDGLVVYLDAANLKSYPLAGSVLTNLVQNGTDGTLGASFSSANLGVFTFNGTGENISIPDVTNVTDFARTDNYTVTCWALINSSNVYPIYNYKAILDKAGRSGETGRNTPYGIVYASSSQEIKFITADATAANSLSLPTTLDTWNMYTGVYSWGTSTLIGYNNTTQNSTSLTLTGTITNTDTVSLMTAQGITNRTGGRIALSMIHNRALSANEVLQNFNATRSRFGV